MDTKKGKRQETRLPRIRTEICEVRVPIGNFCFWCGEYHKTEPKQREFMDELTKETDA